MKPNTEAMQECIHSIHFSWHMRDYSRLSMEALWMADQMHKLLELCGELKREKEE